MTVIIKPNGIKILKCPCGCVPEEMHITQSGPSNKYAIATGDCCDAWNVEFRTVKYDIESEATKQAAIQAWNRAPRADSV